MKNDKTEITAKFIKESRIKLKLKQRELAKIVGKNRVDIAKYETMACMPPGDVILKIYDLLDLNNLL